MLRKTTRHFCALFALSAMFAACNSPEEAETVAEPDEQPEIIAEEPASARPAEWGYEGDEGPNKWASLSTAYALCGEGKSQSPIDLLESDIKGEAHWEMKYNTSALHIAHNENMADILDNGHTIQVTVDNGSAFVFNDLEYDLKQFHFHTPSEHMVNGEHLPMEMHLVHQSADGNLAVVSVLFKEGDEENAIFAPIIANLPNEKGEDLHPEGVQLELGKHLPQNSAAYHYIGSLTTPPCSQDVQWLVLADFVSLSKAQIEAISSRIGGNNRPVQDLNGRKLEKQVLVGSMSN